MKALSVANKFIDIAIENKDFLNLLKLQPLLYFSQGWYMALNEGKELFNEPIEASELGTIVNSVHEEFKKYGNFNLVHKAEVEEIVNIEIIEFIKAIYNSYGRYSPNMVSNMSHVEEGPWYKAYNEKEFYIDNNLMYEYFKGL